MTTVIFSATVGRMISAQTLTAAAGDTHDASPNQYLEIDGTTYAYRRFGATTGTPVLFLQHLRGSMDYRDPAVTDGLAATRPVILFDNAAAFTRGLGLEQVDVLGFSLGGHTAQSYVLRHPDLVRRLVIAGSKPDAPTTRQIFEAQRAAVIDWTSAHGEQLAELASITAPTLVVNGSHDIMAPTINSYLMAQRIPNAQLIIYPDPGHGALFQYPQTFVAHVTEFLDRELSA
jgi:pimeloyl-ACP methyl ester carboxylesterase